MTKEKYYQLLNIANEFYKSYYPAILSDKNNNLDYHHGMISSLFSGYDTPVNFLESNLGYTPTQEDFSIFRNILYGIGITKFHYNENLMSDFNHYKCSTLFDVITSYLEHTQSKDNSFNIWTHFEQKMITKPIILNDISIIAGFIIEDIVFELMNKLINPEEQKTKKIKNSDFFIKQQNDEIIAMMSKEFNLTCYSISKKFADEVKEHYKTEKFIFFNDEVSITIPNIETMKDVSINFFFRDMEKLEKRDINELNVFIYNQKDSMIEEVNKSFDSIYKKNKDILDKNKREKLISNLAITEDIFKKT